MTSHPTPELYVTFRQALPLLQKRIGATRSDFICWLFFDKLKAFCHVHEFAKPPEFNLAGIAMTNWQTAGSDNPPYINALDDAFFLAADIDAFDPPDRFIAFADLVQRWLPHCESQESTANFIHSRINQSRLHDFAPWLGETELSRVFHPSLPDDWERQRPPAEWAMFNLAEVDAIEASDFPSSNHNSARIFKQLDSLEFERPDVPVGRPRLQTKYSSPEYSGIDEAKKEPRTKQIQQQNEIVKIVKSLGYDPLKLPKHSNGHSGVRNEVLNELVIAEGELFGTLKTFGLAWDRCRTMKELKDTT